MEGVYVVLIESCMNEQGEKREEASHASDNTDVCLHIYIEKRGKKTKSILLDQISNKLLASTSKVMELAQTK